VSSFRFGKLTKPEKPVPAVIKVIKLQFYSDYSLDQGKILKRQLNILIQKKLFLSNKFDESITKYGYEDLVFMSDLKKKGIVVKNIDNPSFHLGLETSQQFLDKTKTALENLKIITETSILDPLESKILRTYILLKRFYLNSFISFVFKKMERKMEGNLLSEKPSLVVFDLYKLGYYCSLKN